MPDIKAGLRQDEPAFFEVESVSPRPLREIASPVAQVLDGADSLAPDRGGFSERTRQLGKGGVAGMLENVADRRLRDGLWMIYERRSNQLWGDLRIFPETRLATAPRFHEVAFHLPLLRIQTEEALREAAIQLWCDLFVAIDGFYGRADTAAMRRRRLNLRSAAADRGKMWIPRWNDPTFVIYDRWVEDVWWLNLYGPAYIERWGVEVVERLGVRRRWLDNGGVAVWSCEGLPDPMVARSITGYPHKKSFYDALGQDTFTRESLEIPEPGIRVPLLHEHERSSMLGA